MVIILQHNWNRLNSFLDHRSPNIQRFKITLAAVNYSAQSVDSEATRRGLEERIQEIRAYGVIADGRCICAQRKLLGSILSLEFLGGKGGCSFSIVVFLSLGRDCSHSSRWLVGRADTFAYEF